MIIKAQIIFFILFSLLFNSQALDEGTDILHDHTISTLSVGDGLSQSTVFALFQDSEGFIWMGTRGGGLNRFDGYDFEVFMHSSADSSSLSHNEVLSIFEDSDHSLWVGTRKGELNRFDRNTKKFIRYQTGHSENVSVKCMFEDEDKNLFLGTYKGLFYKAKGTDSFHLFNPDFDMDIQITSIVGLDANTLILGTRSGIYKVNTLTREFSKLFNIVPGPLMGEDFNVPLMVDAKDNVWFGSPNGLYVFSDSGLEKAVKNPFGIDLVDDVHIRTLHQDKKGYVWVGLANGLVKIDPETFNYHLFTPRSNDPNSLSHQSIFSFIEDDNGNFWVGTWGGGVTSLGSIPPKFRHYFHIPEHNSISDNIVSSFAEADNGIWIATEGGGLNFFRHSNKRFTTFSEETGLNLPVKHVKKIFKDSSGMLWIGTWGNGAFRYDPERKKIRRFLADKKVYAFSQYDSDQIWVGTIHGLYRINAQDGSVIHYLKDDNSAGLKDFFITSVFNDSRGNFWVGTHDGGLHLYNKFKDEFINYSFDPDDPYSLIDDYIISITEDHQGNIWIGTNSGICKFDVEKETFKDLTGDINLPNKVINGLVFDHQSDLWISTNKGLTRYNIQTGTSISYNQGDGLQSNEFNRGAYFKNNSDYIFFGGINGFNYFHPEEIKKNPIAPEVILTGFRLFDKPVVPGDETKILEKRISKTHEIVLDYTQSIFSIDFVALNYISTEKNRYKYRLDGYNEEWVDIGNQRSVSFMNLREGKYTFSVIASNNDNVWNEEEASVNITILPPPWKSNWAYLGYFILISLLVIFFHRLIAWRLKERNRDVAEKIEKERIEELNQMKLKFFTNITHEFKTPLTLITAPLDNLMSKDISPDKKEYYYKLIKGNITRLKSLGNQLIDFRKAEQDVFKPIVKQGSLKEFVFKVSRSFTELAEHKKISFLVDCVDHNETRQWFDPEILEKILFNLLSNAFKFTPEGGDVTLMMRLTKNLATISVKDNGIGIHKDEIPLVFDRFFVSKCPEKSHYSGTGIGLSFAKKLTEVHHGSIEVKSEKGKYTVFSVTLPVKPESYNIDELNALQIPDTLGNGNENGNGNGKESGNELVFIEPETTEFQENEHANGNASLMLVVEDNKEIAQYLVNQFSGHFKVYSANNGHDGYEMARELIPDVIISDIMMDKMTGLELCRKVKDDIITTHIPVVLLTVLVSDDNKMDGLEVGADAYVEKPFEIKYLQTVVNNLLKQRVAMKEKYLLENIHAAGSMTNKTESKFLKKVEEIMENHYSDPGFSIITLSEKLNVSRSQLFRKFKLVTGKSPSDFIRIVRLKKAAEMILRDDIGVNEVAYESGFNSPSHFISCFKKYFGKTPKDYAASVNQ